MPKKQKFEHCHPNVEAILSLPKICSSWVTINIFCDLQKKETHFSSRT
jgi:hypothetical protein